LMLKYLYKIADARLGDLKCREVGCPRNKQKIFSV
jgi:hypothetical protein